MLTLWFRDRDPAELHRSTRALRCRLPLPASVARARARRVAQGAAPRPARRAQPDARDHRRDGDGAATGSRAQRGCRWLAPSSERASQLAREPTRWARRLWQGGRREEEEEQLGNPGAAAPGKKEERSRRSEVTGPEPRPGESARRGPAGPRGLPPTRLKKYRFLGLVKTTDQGHRS